MGTGYQEEKKEQYEKMMEEIAAHPDFGKRNPVDIGVECGYQEEAVEEMICFLRDNKNDGESLTSLRIKKDENDTTEVKKTFSNSRYNIYSDEYWGKISTILHRTNKTLKKIK